MKIKTSELQGAALIWAVAKCEGESVVALLNEGAPEVWYSFDVVSYNGESCYTTRGGNPRFIAEGGKPVGLFGNPVEYDWGSFGPIIEREKIDFIGDEGGEWFSARIYLHDEMVEQQGYTHLVAAMRCYVASKLGDEVEIPEELL